MIHSLYLNLALMILTNAVHLLHPAFFPIGDRSLQHPHRARHTAGTTLHHGCGEVYLIVIECRLNSVRYMAVLAQPDVEQRVLNVIKKFERVDAAKVCIYGMILS